MKIRFVTNNKLKTKIARHSLSSFGILVEQVKLNLPEIQSDSVEEIAIHSAKTACEMIGKPIIVGDTGFFIEFLNGFPGPYIKYINSKLRALQFAQLYTDVVNPKAYFFDVLSYCEPGKEPMCFFSKTYGHLLSAPKGYSDQMIESLFVPQHYSKTLAEMSEREQVQLWSNDRYVQLARHLQTT